MILQKSESVTIPTIWKLWHKKVPSCGNEILAVPLHRRNTSWERLAYFCLPIAEMDYYDLTPTPPVFKHFDLMTGEVSNGFVGERFKNK